jgi:hypothetical protein
MSDEPKKRSRALVVWALLVALIVASYETLHYATAEAVSMTRPDGVSVTYDRHKIRRKQVPGWVERYFFWPAEWIGDLFRSRPWHSWPSD